MDKCDVAISGAGPVGLLLACMLAKENLDVRLIEAQGEHSGNSRAIGIHPPGLRCLEGLGLAHDFVERGVRVEQGHAFAQGRELGSISFADMKGPYPFVLSLPQSDTEQLLENALQKLSPRALERRCRVSGLEMHRGFCRLNVESEQGAHSLHARFVIGCDGKRSVLRDHAGIGYVGGPYPKRFAMVDAHDDTPFANDGAVFLHAEGLVESFPLPEQRRRWVASFTSPIAELSELQAAIAARTGFSVNEASAGAMTTFTAEHYLAQRLVHGALVLAGDAAHVISPIGGQGMNLGWQDAHTLADILLSSWRKSDELRERLQTYEKERIRAAEAARRRAEVFMALGTSGGGPMSRAAMRMLLAPWWHRKVARVFTMGGA
jgi:2-polyprenyl-6-methoxyphenol hydroxylase-like FAD-dependent oxidoreductase